MPFRSPRLFRRAVTAVVAAVALGALVTACSTEFISQAMLSTEPEANGVGAADYGLYLAEGNDYPVTDMAAALDALGPADGSDRALVLFVHGMGTYPGKAYRWETLERIEQQYPADVLMFHWPAWIDFLTIPRGNAAASGAYLA